MPRLVRRAYFDLIGLPPELEELAKRFSMSSSLRPSLAATDSEDGEKKRQREGEKAYETLIDRLLASPHYGERWRLASGHVPRFAESHGFEQDYDRPYAYHFRDFVIDAQPGHAGPSVRAVAARGGTSSNWRTR